MFILNLFPSYQVVLAQLSPTSHRISNHIAIRFELFCCLRFAEGKEIGQLIHGSPFWKGFAYFLYQSVLFVENVMGFGRMVTQGGELKSLTCKPHFEK